jgi:hypothetical protein
LINGIPLLDIGMVEQGLSFLPLLVLLMIQKSRYQICKLDVKEPKGKIDPQTHEKVEPYKEINLDECE